MIKNLLQKLLDKILGRLSFDAIISGLTKMIARLEKLIESHGTKVTKLNTVIDSHPQTIDGLNTEAKRATDTTKKLKDLIGQ